MPSSIPYSPSLVLGSVVHTAAMTTLREMSALQTPVDAAQDTLNSFISLKRSLEMTASELVNMNIDPKDLLAKMPDVDTQLEKAAVTYATTRVQQELQMQPLRAKVQLVNAGVESPIDYQLTVIKPMPLAADTLKMDAQYFSFDQNEQKAQNTISNIQKFITLAGSYGDAESGFEMAKTAVKQINHQRQMHKVAGTLVLTANCTHRQATVLAPLVLAVEGMVEYAEGNASKALLLFEQACRLARGSLMANILLFGHTWLALIDGRNPSPEQLAPAGQWVEATREGRHLRAMLLNKPYWAIAQRHHPVLLGTAAGLMHHRVTDVGEGGHSSYAHYLPLPV